VFGNCRCGANAGEEKVFLYLTEKDGKTLFYGNDVGFFRAAYQ
jgi:hypothetical protein